MLTPLDLKLFRDLGRMKGQIVAVSLVMACGLAMMIMTRSIILTLESTRDAYYQRYRLADVFASLKRAPLSLAERIAELPGVAAIEPRVVVEATLDLVGVTEPASAHIVSLPEDRPQTLNQVFIRQGRLPLPDERRQVVRSSTAIATRSSSAASAFRRSLSLRPGPGRPCRTTNATACSG
jgi:putative ABC transport system permease protein